MNAIVINFKNSVPTPVTTDFFKVGFGYFLQSLNLWGDEYDKVYVLDSSWNFNEKERRALDKATNGKGVILETNPNLCYTEAWKAMLPMIEEDKVLFIHDDTMIYKKGFVKKIFDNLDKYGVVSAFETIGTLTDRINKKWPVMRGYSNFASCLFGIKRDLLKPFEDFPFEMTHHYEVGTHIPELDYTTVEGDWVETLGRAAIMLLGKGVPVLEVVQDKENLFYQTPPAVEKNTITEWHHVRYGLAMARMLCNKYHGWPTQYQDDLLPHMVGENVRKMAWYWIANQNPYFTIKEKFIFEVLADLGVSKESWFEYLTKFKIFHSIEEVK